MALAYRTSAVGGNTVSGTSPTVTITPASGDLFLVFCQAVGNANTAPTCSDGNTGGSYTLLFTAASAASANTLSCFVRNNILANTTSTTVTVAIGAHTAAEVCVVALSGGTVGGAAAVVQQGTQVNQASATTPAPALSNAPHYGDIVLSAVGNATNPAGVTATANTAIWTWTRQQNAGQTGCGLCVESSPGALGALPGAAVTWGSTSASAFASCAVELAAPPSNAGQNASKLVAYAALASPIGVDVEKLVAYGVMAPPVGVNVSKLVAYAVLNSINTNPPVWPTITPPVGYVGNPYSLVWDLTTAASPTTYTLLSGSLPPGLTLNNVGGADGNVGSITGTPTTIGSYSFVLTATNTYGSANDSLTIVIQNPVGGGGSFVFVG